MVLQADRLDDDCLPRAEPQHAGDFPQVPGGIESELGCRLELALGVAPPGLQDRCGEPVAGRAWDPPRHVELPDRPGIEDALTPTGHESGLRMFDVLGAQTKPGHAGLDLLDFASYVLIRFPLKGGGHLQPIMVAILPDLVRQGGYPPGFVFPPGTAREFVAGGVKPASEDNRPSLILDQLDDDPIAVPQVDILVEIRARVDPELVDPGFQSPAPPFLRVRIRHVE